MAKKIIDDINSYHNKIIKMEITKSNISLQVLSFHNTHEDIKNYVKGYFKDENTQIILGDFNDEEWINDLNSDKKINYKDLVTNFMITFKPAQTSIDRIFVKNDKAIINKIVFNGVTETFASDHNLLSFLLNI